MSQRIRVDLIDDLDGSRAEESVEFALDGVSYIIDLSADNAAKFRDTLSTWTTAARRAGGRRSRHRHITTGPSAGEIRRWAHEQGMEISERGRIPFEVREAYAKAH